MQYNIGGGNGGVPGTSHQTGIPVAPMYPNTLPIDDFNRPRVNYSVPESRNQNHWKHTIYLNLATICCNFFIAGLYAVIIGLGLMIESLDIYQNLTIYTQGSTDW